MYHKSAIGHSKINDVQRLESTIDRLYASVDKVWCHYADEN